MQSKNKNILILGASLLQKPAIQSAKELCCKVFVVDGNPKALCVPLADVFEQIDLKDEEKLLNVQFHEMYSNDEFIEGYRPDDIGIYKYSFPLHC